MWITIISKRSSIGSRMKQSKTTLYLTSTFCWLNKPPNSCVTEFKSLLFVNHWLTMFFCFVMKIGISFLTYVNANLIVVRIHCVCCFTCWTNSLITACYDGKTVIWCLNLNREYYIHYYENVSNFIATLWKYKEIDPCMFCSMIFLCCNFDSVQSKEKMFLV